MSMVSPGVAMLHGLSFDVAGASEQGPRSENQDALYLADFPRTGVLAVADGMGGQRGGRTAAETTVRTIAAAGAIPSLDAARHAVRGADEAVARAAGESSELAGMGAALAVLALSTDRGGDPGWVGAHVGDVRILSRAPDGTVRLETRDHTVAFARWEAGEIGLDEIADTPGANRLQRAVGHGGEADTVWIPARPGWSYLLISDGITKAMRIDELGDALGRGDAAAACEAIMRKVEERGPDDNFTAVVARILPQGDTNATLPTPGAAPLAARPEPRTSIFNPSRSVTAPRRSPLAPVATALSALALGAAGFALWTAQQTRGADAARAAEIVNLRNGMDSLRARAAVPETVAPIRTTDTVATIQTMDTAPAVPLTVSPPPAPPAGARP